MKWTNGLQLKTAEEQATTIKVGDTIKMYGAEVVVTGFYMAYNNAISKWEPIILTKGRGGDPIIRTMGNVEVLVKS